MSAAEGRKNQTKEALLGGVDNVNQNNNQGSNNTQSSVKDGFFLRHLKNVVATLGNAIHSVEAATDNSVVGRAAKALPNTKFMRQQADIYAHSQNNWLRDDKPASSITNRW